LGLATLTPYLMTLQPSRLKALRLRARMNRGRREARAEDDARVITGMVSMITGIHLMKIYFG
jgi:hypothetical protein